jgi:hypothetical protein
LVSEGDPLKDEFGNIKSSTSNSFGFPGPVLLDPCPFASA